MTTQTLPDAGTVTMYSTTWCGYCRRLKTQLDSAGIGYTEIDIEDHPDAADARRVAQRRQPDRPDRGLPRRVRRDEPVARRRSRRA